MAGMTKSMETMKTWVQSTMDTLKVKERGSTLVTFAKERPVAATLIGVAIATSILPAVAFVSFVATFLIIGVVTLLIIEGTAILSAIGILLFALIGSMVASVFIGAFLLASLVAGRFTWRITAPLRTKMTERLGMVHGMTTTTAVNPEEKGHMETGPTPDLVFTANKAGYEEESD